MGKTCTNCKQEKEEDKFSPGSSWCKYCRNEWMLFRKHYLKEKDIMYMHPERAKVNEEDKYLDYRDWETLTKCVKDTMFLYYLDITQSLGLRANETFMLKIEDFDWMKGTVKVTSLKRKDKAKLLLYVRPDLLVKIKKDGLVFKFKYPSAWAQLKRELKRNKLNERLGLHSLRHLAATRLQDVGANSFEIGRMLRHTPQGVTGRYVHITPQRLEQLAKLTWEKQPLIWKV